MYKLVYPILSYGCEVWGLCESHVLEKVHLNFCKKLLRVRATTQNSFVYGELGRTTLLTKRAVSVIKYWLKIVRLDEIKYSKVVYKCMLREVENNPNHSSWATSVRNLLQSLGFNDAWLFQGVGNENAF